MCRRSKSGRTPLNLLAAPDPLHATTPNTFDEQCRQPYPQHLRHPKSIEDVQAARHQAGMATVAIWKSMNQHKLMMKANGYLIFIENMILDLVTSFIEQITQLHGHLCPINADILIG